MSKKKLDPISEIALETVAMEQNKEAQIVQDQTDREQRIAQCHEMIGRIKGVKMIADFANVGGLMWLKGVKESKLYRDLPNIGTWESFCNYIGMSRQKVDEDLLNLSTFGEQFLANVGGLSVGYRELKKLRQLTAEGTVTIDEAEIVINGERIPFTPEHRDDLQNALECVIETNAKIITEKNEAIKAKDRVLKQKEDLIQQQTKEIIRIEDAALRNGMMPAEDAFIKRLEKVRTELDGSVISIDPLNNPLPEDATPRMRAVYIETLAYFRRVFEAAHETAISYYDISTLENDGWVPPSADE